MPTYKNRTNDTIYDIWQPIQPGDTYETTRILDDKGLTRLSDDPYYFLANDYHDVSFGAA